ncbi:MAG TPA: 50S ribosomal protein L25 [Actinomycetota bacterium]|nr:50S ribosomal protein L25 [Actinomycetota bacterium]
MERTLKAERRRGAGKGEARKLRAQGRVPAILYGHGVDPTPIAVDAKDLYRLLHTAAGANVLIDLRVDGERHLALAREVQRDHIKGRYVHVDFFAVRRDEQVKVTVPVRIVGEAPGVKQGGLLEHHLWEVQLQCRVDRVPDAVDADVSVLGIGDALRAGDLRIPDGAQLLTDPEEQVVSVVTPQVLEVVEVAPVEAPEEGEAAPEAASEAAAGEEGGEG